MAREISFEKHYKIWDVNNGSRYEVGPDFDDPNFVMLSYFDSNKSLQDKIVMDKESAAKIAEAIVLYLHDQKP